MKVDMVVDDFPASDKFGPYPLKKASDEYDNVIVTIGDCRVRRRISEQVRANGFPVVIHPISSVASDVPVGEGTVMMVYSVAQSGASIGRHCIINTGSIVEHDVKVGDYVHIASGAVICGGVEIGEGTWIGAGSVIRQYVKIGKNCMIGAGSVVVKDIPDDVVAYGSPCRVVRKNE